MSKATREIKDAEKERIRQHVAWLTMQGPLVRALTAYTEFCSVFVPTPEEKWKQDLHPRPRRGVLVPPITDEEIRIPAGHRVMFHSDDHKYDVVCVRCDPDEKGRRPVFMMELFDGFELALPGGRTATLRKGPKGWSMEESREAGDGVSG